MNFTLYPATKRGGADHGWLKAKHTFSFASWYNPEQMNFGVLRVLNDDWIAAGQGFGTHPHDNMEIITIPHTGALAHKDSLGTNGIINAGDVQVMSAGTGIQHSEFNASQKDACTLFQIWLFPKIRGVQPRYDQKTFDTNAMQNQLLNIVAPINTENDALKIHQDAYFSMGYFSEATTLQYTVKKAGNGVFIQNVKGEISWDNQVLGNRDAVGVWDVDSITLEIKENSQVLLMEVPMS